MAFQVNTAITLPTHICINKHMEIKVLLVQVTWHRLPESTRLNHYGLVKKNKEISHTYYKDKSCFAGRFRSCSTTTHTHSQFHCTPVTWNSLIKTFVFFLYRHASDWRKAETRSLMNALRKNGTAFS